MQVDAGGVFSCAVKSDAALACWGSNGFGQATPPAGSFSAVGSGGFHACALRSGDGSVACWGRNVEGQLNAPTGSFTAIAAGANHTCALKGDGSIACWGESADGRLVVPPGTFTAVSAGGGAHVRDQDRRHGRLLGREHQRTVDARRPEPSAP